MSTLCSCCKIPLVLFNARHIGWNAFLVEREIMTTISIEVCLLLCEVTASAKFKEQSWKGLNPEVLNQEVYERVRSK